MSEKLIMLVEDSPDDEELTTRALRQAKIANEIVVARDGAEAIDFLFGEGAYAGRDVSRMPAVLLLEPELLGIFGGDMPILLQALTRINVLTTVNHFPSSPEKALLESYQLVPHREVHSRIVC